MSESVLKWSGTCLSLIGAGAYHGCINHCDASHKDLS